MCAMSRVVAYHRIRSSVASRRSARTTQSPCPMTAIGLRHASLNTAICFAQLAKILAPNEVLRCLQDLPGTSSPAPVPANGAFPRPLRKGFHFSANGLAMRDLLFLVGIVEQHRSAETVPRGS